jgi:DNA-binding transcriptional LysR family regulator
MELDTIEATKKMVEEGLGIALLPKVSTEREFEHATLVPIAIADASLPRRQISLIFRRNRKYTRAVTAFFTLLADLYEVTIPEAALSGVA